MTGLSQGKMTGFKRFRQQDSAKKWGNTFSSGKKQNELSGHQEN